MFGGVFGPIKKARAYSQIDYSNIYEKLKFFEEEKKSIENNPKKQFSEELKKYNEVDVLQKDEKQYNTENQNKNIDETDIYL